MTITVHDFTRPPPLAPELRAGLAQWLGRSNALLAEMLGAMSVAVELKFADSLTVFPVESMSGWTDKSFGYRALLSGHDAPSLIAVPNPLMQDLVGRLVGNLPETLPEERDLTPAESSVAEFVIENIVTSLKEAWQGDIAMGLSVGEPDPNLRRTKLFRPAEPIVVCRSTVKTSLGESHWSWMMTNDFLLAMFGLPTRASRTASDKSSRRHLEHLILGMRTELEIRLGGVQLTGPQLSRLSVGDVVVLDQRVSEPLQASIRGEPKFMGWAGRVGSRQAFEVASIVEPRQAVPVPDVA